MRALPKLKPAEGDAAHAAAQKVVEVHRRLAGFVKAGMTLAKVDAFVERTLTDLRCRSAFFGYRIKGHPPFPSHACLSLNHCVVHGTAGYHTKPLAAGDVLKLDIGVFNRAGNQEWVGDAGWTYSIGEPAPEVRRLMDCGKRAIAEGVAAMRPGSPYIGWARAVQGRVEASGFKCIERWGGHGIGTALHGPPHISNTVPRFPGEWPEAMNLWEPGVLVAVEPMLAMTTGETYQKFVPNTKDKVQDWPVYTQDGSISVHYEHDVLITNDGPWVLTEGMDELPDVL